MANTKPSTKKDKSTAKKKSSLKKGSSDQEEQAHDVSLTVVAFDETVGEFQTPPASSGQCILWRDGDVHSRIRAALSVWSHQPLNNIISNTTLGQLAVGTGIPWNEGNQARLVQATNEQNVFFPFQSRMNPPPVLVPSTTTVAEWERVVWTMQTPETFCFVFGS